MKEPILGVVICMLLLGGIGLVAYARRVSLGVRTAASIRTIALTAISETTVIRFFGRLALTYALIALFIAALYLVPVL